MQDLTVGDRVEVMKSCLDFVIMDIRPIAALGGQGLHSLLGTFARLCVKYNGFDKDPGEYLPGATAISDQINEQSEMIKGKIGARLRHVFTNNEIGGALCIDIYTDSNGTSYLGVVAHYVDESFSINTRVLATRPLTAGMASVIPVNICTRFFRRF